MPPAWRPPGLAGFWPRTVAFLIDCMVLAAAGLLLGVIFFNQFAALGAWGRLLGFGIAGLYFGLRNSALSGGQTIGKRLMQIAVVDRAGRPVGIGRSLLRYAILGVPYFLNTALLAPSVQRSWVGMVIGFVIFSLGGAILYLYVFNVRSRRSVHDLVAGTYVVDAGSRVPPGTAPVWPGHFVVIGLWCAAVLGGSVLGPTLLQHSAAAGLAPLQDRIVATGEVHTAGVFVGRTFERVGDFQATASFIRVTAYWKTRPLDYAASARHIARLVLTSYPGAQDKDAIVVTVVYGYDIGIAHEWRRQIVSHTPAEWRAIINDALSHEI